MASNEIIDQCKFFKRKQLVGESFNEFYDGLKGIARNCSFGQIEEKMLKCQIVRGIANKALKTLFLQENPDLQDIILRCREAEVDKFQGMPDELIVRIMSYLPLEDRKRTRLVSKRWHAISFTKSLVKHDWTMAKSFDDLRKFELFQRHSNVKLSDSDGNDYCVDFWQAHGNQIQAIAIRNFYGENFAAMLSTILQHCPKVKVISLKKYCYARGEAKIERSCSRVRLEHLSSLRLDLSFPPKTVFDDLDQVLDAPNLSQMYVRMYTSDLSLSLAKLMTRHSSSIKELDLHCLDSEIFGSLGPELTKLDIMRIDNSLLPLLAKKCPNLRQLGISTSGLEWSELAQTLRHLTNLTHISLRGTYLTGDTDHTFFHSEQMDQLVAIDLSSGNWTADTYRVVFSTLRPNLVDVRLNSQCRGILDQILLNVPNLQVLKLEHHIDEEDVRLIASHNKKLKYWDLSHTDISLCPSLNTIGSLERLKFGLRASGDFNVLLQLCLPKLERINVPLGYKPTVQDMIGLVERCPKLYEVIQRDHGNLCDEVSAKIARRRPSRRVEGRFNFWSAVRVDE